jgi:hypothetical protein
MSRLTSRLAVLALLGALALFAAACGGGGDKSSAGGSDADAASLLKDTFGADHPIRSGRVNADVDVDLKGLAQLATPLNLHLEGPFQSNGGTTLPDFALALDLGGSKPLTVGTVFAQGGGYLTVEGQAFDLGADRYKAFKTGYEKAKKEASSSTAAKDSSFAALGISPLRWLKDPKNAGTEDIADAHTIHITAGVDVAKLLADVSTLLGKAQSVTGSAAAATGTSVPTALTADQRDAITKSITSAKVDVWTGAKDHTLRKVAVNVQVDVPADLRAQAGNLKTGHVIFQITIAQLNQAQKISKPADVQPIADLRKALTDLGLISSSSTPATTTAPEATETTPATPEAATPAPTAATPQAAADPQAQYAACISSAGEDLAAVQDCAQYLK